MLLSRALILGLAFLVGEIGVGRDGRAGAVASRGSEEVVRRRDTVAKGRGGKRGGIGVDSLGES